MRDRLADGQFDDCELTFKDLEKIIASVTRSLTGMLHGRIDYPDAPDLRRQPAVEPGRAGAAGAGRRGRLPPAGPWPGLCPPMMELLTRNQWSPDRPPRRRPLSRKRMEALVAALLRREGRSRTSS